MIVASIVVFFGKRVTSLHTGSNYVYRKEKGPHLLRWKVILAAKEKGYKEYDFWGINEKKWPGLTYFKKGFGGKGLEYPQGKDIIFQDNWYKIYKTLKKIISR
jgi:lipid II:glycine glycyltransferase (peptidoglycan interpeptide bridge formation enzyme)